MPETSLKHVLKEEYAIYCRDSEGNPCYISTIYNSSISTTKDIDDSMKIKSLDGAKGALALAKDIRSSCDYHICHISTVVEDIDLEF